MTVNVNTACDECAAVWRVEACDIHTGVIRAVLPYVSFDAQMLLNAPGQGSISIPTRAVSARDIWPWLTLIAISRIDADPTNPEGVFLGVIDTFEGSNPIDLRVGMVSIEQYLWRRKIRDTMVFSHTMQTAIARNLVNYCTNSGTENLPLSAVAALSQQRRTITYLDTDRSLVGDAINNLVTIQDGLDWETDLILENGSWSAVMTFRDTVGEDRNVMLKSDREGSAYGLTVDGSNLQTLIDATGAGDPPITSAAASTGPYPQLDGEASFTDIATPQVLDSLTEGEVARLSEPATVIPFTIPGPTPEPTDLRLGDTVHVESDVGGLTYVGDARLIDLTYSSQVGASYLRTLGLQPLTPASESVLNQEATDPCPDCGSPE